MRTMVASLVAFTALALALPAPLQVATDIDATPTPSAEPWIVPGRRYYFPIQPHRIARYADEHHSYPAADIFVPVGSVVVAVTDGVVDEANRIDRWERRTNDGAARGGLWVTLIGDDGVRYHNSHLSVIEPDIVTGTRVHAGQVIGHSGKSGNAASTPPHVHFGISRPTYPGDWINRRGQISPYRYLKAWTRGQDLTPALPPAISPAQPTGDAVVVIRSLW